MFDLLIQVNNEELRKLYEEQISLKEKTYSYFHSDSGFDLFMPKDIKVNPKETKMIDLDIRCEPKFPGGYYLYPRSSFGKTSLRFKNSVGIIDNLYRGNIKMLIENTSDTEIVEMKKGERYGQLCHPSLITMQVKIVDKVNDTSRGLGGFGSTGK
jgi:dUTP pyrophosphatase